MYVRLCSVLSSNMEEGGEEEGAQLTCICGRRVALAAWRIIPASIMGIWRRRMLLCTWQYVYYMVASLLRGGGTTT